MASILDGILALFSCFWDVFGFWASRLWTYFTFNRRKHLTTRLHNSQSFEDWQDTALELDKAVDNDAWRYDMVSRHYDWRLIDTRLDNLNTALYEGDVLTVVDILRSGLVRNLGNITSPKLFNRAYAGTKCLIDEYVNVVADAVRYVVEYGGGDGAGDLELSSQNKLDLLHDTRQAFGRTVLVLQGGSIFGICHVGVVKALHLRGLLPRIIAGTATGALMAALVGVKTEDELLESLSGSGVDLTAFVASSERAAAQPQHPGWLAWLHTLRRRIQRFVRYGYVLDPKVLEQSVRANVGDLTFEEAYNKSKRVLNITISTNGRGVPSLLNYITAPNVLVWSAAMASNASDPSQGASSLLAKNSDGEIEPWALLSGTTPTRRNTVKRRSGDRDRNAPLSRIAELFNVNHFIVSQARPYIAPFLSPSLHHSTSSPRSSRTSISTFVMRLIMMEIQHRLTQADQLGLLPSGLRRLLLDEHIPGASLTLVPEVGLRDFARLLRNPTEKEIDYWILRGERSVWPAVGAITVRCAVEVELDRGYQVVRRRKPFDVGNAVGAAAEGSSRKKSANVGHKRKRRRAASSGG
ncbi:hypothetical protein MBLNU230_g1197t1 [Neophaeotheca triangularis]